MYSSYLIYVGILILYTILTFLVMFFINAPLGLIMFLFIFPLAIFYRIKLRLEKEKIVRDNHDNLEKIAKNTEKKYPDN